LTSVQDPSTALNHPKALQGHRKIISNSLCGSRTVPSNE
jgi:hypothetical protein